MNQNSAHKYKVTHDQRYPELDLMNLKFDFFKHAITGFIEDFRRNIRLFVNDVPVYIINTGDKLMTDEWLDANSVEIPRIECDIDNITINSDQLSSPYERGDFIVTNDNGFDNGYSAYLRRIPITLAIPCKIFTSNILTNLYWQEILLLLLYKNNVYHFQYYKKDNRGSYRLPDDMSSERNIEFGFDDARRYRTINFTINIDLQYPAFDFISGSLKSVDNTISNIYNGIISGTDVIPGHMNNDPDSTEQVPPLIEDHFNIVEGVDIDDIYNPGSALDTGTQIPDSNGNYDSFDIDAINEQIRDIRKLNTGQANLKSNTNSYEPIFPMSVHTKDDILKN